MAERYPGYDVLTKRNSPSWNPQTREVIDQRLAIAPDAHGFCPDAAWRTLCALCDRIVPQPAGRAHPVPVAALVDLRLQGGGGDGYRDARLPDMREAWLRGLAAIDAEALQRHRLPFAQLQAPDQDALLTDIQAGRATSPAWQGMPPGVFFARRVLHDVVSAYYAHPLAWSEIGFGGPAAPRGYVRMGFDRRDPWEAAEAHPGGEEQARRANARVG